MAFPYGETADDRSRLFSFFYGKNPAALVGAVHGNVPGVPSPTGGSANTQMLGISESAPPQRRKAMAQDVYSAIMGTSDLPNWKYGPRTLFDRSSKSMTINKDQIERNPVAPLVHESLHARQVSPQSDSDYEMDPMAYRASAELGPTLAGGLAEIEAARRSGGGISGRVNIGRYSPEARYLLGMANKHGVFGGSDEARRLGYRGNKSIQIDKLLADNPNFLRMLMDRTTDEYYPDPSHDVDAAYSVSQQPVSGSGARELAMLVAGQTSPGVVDSRRAGGDDRNPADADVSSQVAKSTRVTPPRLNKYSREDNALAGRWNQAYDQFNQQSNADDHLDNFPLRGDEDMATNNSPWQDAFGRKPPMSGNSRFIHDSLNDPLNAYGAKLGTIGPESRAFTSPISTNRPGGTPRGGAHGEVWSPEYGSRVHPMVPGGGAPYRIPDGPSIPYTRESAPRLGSGSNQSFSFGSGHEQLLSRANNGYYLNGDEQQALLMRYGKGLSEKLATPGAGAGVRMNDWKRRTDRLRAMADALGVGDDGGAPNDQTYQTSVGAPNGAPAGGMSGGASGAAPYSAPGQVPSPGYMGMSSPQPVDTMLSGNDYLQNMAQTKRLQRQNRMAGMDPRAAQLMGHAQQNASRGFMGEKGLMEQGMANQANAAAMGFNSDMYRNRVGESLGLGSLGLQDATRRDVASESSAKTRMMEEEQRRRGAFMDQLMGVTAESSAPQSSTGSGFLDAAMNGFGTAQVPMAPSGGGGDAFGGDMWKKAFAYDQLSPGLGTSLAKGEMDRRQQPNPDDAYAIAAMNAAAQAGNPTMVEQLHKERMAGRGVGVPGMQIAAEPSKDANGNPKIDKGYIQKILSQIPPNTPKEHILSILKQNNINPAQLEDAYDQSGPSYWDQFRANPVVSGLNYPVDKLFNLDAPRNRRISRETEFRDRLKALQDQSGGFSDWFNSATQQPIAPKY